MKAGPAHGFDDVVGEQRAAVEVDLRVLGGGGDVGVGGKMDDPVVAVHSGGEGIDVAGVGADDFEARIAGVRLVVPLAAR